MADLLLQPAYVLQLSESGAFASIPAIAAYNVGTGDFTLEAWISTTQGGPVVTLAGPSSAVFACTADGALSLSVGGTRQLESSASSAANGTWHHIAFVRSASSGALYLDGVEQSTGSVSQSITSLTALLIGAANQNATSGTFLGRCAQVCIWNVAVSQADLVARMVYRAQAQSGLVGAWSFVSQNLNDSSSFQNNAGTLTRGTYQFTGVNIEPTLYSLGLTGAQPCVSCSGNAAYNVGVNPFTVEAWCRATTPGTIISRSVPGQNAGTLTGFSVDVGADGRLSATLSNGTDIATARQDPDAGSIFGAWHHVALVRSSTLATLFLDGRMVGTATVPGGMSVDVPTSVALQFGNARSQITSRARVSVVGGPPLPASVSPFTMQLAEVRFWNLARDHDHLYREMLQQRHGNEAGLIGYWNFNTANVIDASPTRNLSVTQVANITPDTLDLAPPQYVARFDGTASSYVSVASNAAFDFGDGDFTVELRFRATGPGTLVDRPYITTKPSCGLRVRADMSSLQLILGDSTPTTYSASVALLDGAWHHVAFARQSGSILAFVDDRLVSLTGAATSTQRVTTVAPLSFGSAYAPATSTWSDGVVGAIDFASLWAFARKLADLQQSSFETTSNLNAAAGAWSFDQQAALDLSQTGANGALGAAARIVADDSVAVAVPHSVVCLDSADAVVDCGARRDLAFGGVQPFTVAAWIRPLKENATGTIFADCNADMSAGYRLRLVNGVPVAQRAAQNGTVSGISRLAADVWSSVAMTYDGTTLRILVNGIVESSIATGAINAATGINPLIGASPNTQGIQDPLLACVQNVHIWSTALDPATLDPLLSTWLTGTEPDLLASWDFLYASAQDWTGRGAATLVNAMYQSTTFQPGRLRTVVAFNGDGAFVNAGTGRDLNVRDALTLEAWIHVTAFDTEWQPIAAKGDVFQLRRYQNTSQITFSTGGLTVSELPSSRALLDGMWHHVAAVYDGAFKYLYIDGALDAKVAATGNIAVGNGRLYVPNRDGEVLLLDAETGNTSWTAYAFGDIQTTPVVDKEILCVSAPSGNIFGYDVRSKQRIWDCPVPQNAQIPISVHRDIVYFSGAGSVISAVDIHTGKLLWSMNGIANQVPPVIDGTSALYGMNTMLTARDLTTQRVIWVLSLPDQIVGRPIVLGSSTIVACADGTLYSVVADPTVRIAGRLQLSGTPVGGPVLEDGLIYVALDNKTVQSLTFSEGNSPPFSSNWSAALPGVPTAAPSVDAPYCGVECDDGTLVFVDTATGSKVWEYAKASGDTSLQLTGVLVAAGAAYFGASDQTYNAVDIHAKRVIWAKNIQSLVAAQPALTFAPFCIGASVDALGKQSTSTYHGLISEVRLWNVARSAAEIAATWQRTVVGDEHGLVGYWGLASPPMGTELDLSRHLNTGTFVGTALSAPSQLVLRQPMPRLIAQANMIQHWTAADVAADNVAGGTAFRTEITLLDGTGQPMSGAGISVWTDATATVEVNGVQYATSNSQSVDLATDPRGMITVVTPCNALTSPTLQVWSPFMETTERVIIHPDDNLASSLQSLTGKDLVAPQSSTNPYFRGKPPLLPNLTQAQADQLASAVNTSITNVKSPATQVSRYAIPGSRTARLYAGVGAAPPGPGDAQSNTVVLTGNQPYARTVGPGVIPNWKFDYQTYQFSPLSNAEVARHNARVRALAPMSEEVTESLWDWFVNGVEKVANVIISVVEAGVQIVVDWVEKGIDTLQRIFKSVQEVGQAVFGLFMQAIGAVADAARKVYDFFAFVFDWDDILRVKQVILDSMTQMNSTLDQVINDFIAQEQKFFGDLETQADQAFGSLIARLSTTSLDTVRGMAPQVNPLLDGAASGPPALTAQARFAAAQQQSETFGVEGNWLLSTTLGSAGQSSGFGAPAFTDSLQQSMQEIFDSLASWAASSKAVAAFQRAFDYFMQIGSNPQSFGQLLIQGVAEAVRGIVDLAIEAAQMIVTLLLKALKAMVDALFAAMTATVEIPVISWLYRKVSNADLSVLDFLALVVAIPTAVIYKAFTGESPFKALEAAEVEATGGNLTVIQKIRYTAAGVAQIINSFIAVIGDVQGVVEDVLNMQVARWVSIVGYVGYGLTAIGIAAFIPEYIAMLPVSAPVAGMLLLELVAAGYIVYRIAPGKVNALVSRVRSIPTWILMTVYGCIRLVMLLISFFGLGSITTSDFVKGLFTQLPNICKFLRKPELVVESEGITFAVLAVVDLVGGIVGGSIQLAQTWGSLSMSSTASGRVVASSPLALAPAFPAVVAVPA